MTATRSSFDGSAHIANMRLNSYKHCQAYRPENMRPADKEKALYYLNNMETDDNADKFYELCIKYSREESINGAVIES